MLVLSLSRPAEQGQGPEYPFLRPRPAREPPSPTPGEPRWSKPDRERAMEFMASKPRWPGVKVGRVAAFEAELDSFNMRERVMLEIEMSQRRSLHSFDYDPLGSKEWTR